MKSNTLHVVFLSRSYPTPYDPTTAVFVCEQAKALATAGIKIAQIAVVFVSWKRLIRLKFHGFGYRALNQGDVQVSLYVTPVIPFIKRINQWRRDRILKKLSDRYIEKNGMPDVCHTHGIYTGNEAIRLKQKYSIPFVITEHYSVFGRNLLNRRELKMAAKVYQESTVRFAVSVEFKALLEKKFSLEFQYLPNIVDVEKFVPLSSTDDSENFIILNVGRLDRNKNQTLLLKALAMLPEEFSVIIAGEGPEKKRLQKQANDLGIQHRIQFLGFVPHDKLIPLFQKAGILAVTSLYETFGIVMIEAMSCGTPVVSTPVGTATWLINDERLGYVADFEAAQIADAIQKVKLNQVDRNFIRNFAVSNFSSGMISQKLIQIYNQII